VVEQAFALVGKIDVIVNNAGWRQEHVPRSR
jgi:NAD(P)-dependent dehydrogenase (short-subunit alcohol dehydrogenase family)